MFHIAWDFLLRNRVQLINGGVIGFGEVPRLVGVKGFDPGEAKHVAKKVLFTQPVQDAPPLRPLPPECLGNAERGIRAEKPQGKHLLV